jgi:hypothetical protein
LEEIKEIEGTQRTEEAKIIWTAMNPTIRKKWLERTSGEK